VRIIFVDNLLFEDAEGIRRYVLQPHLGLISLIAVLEAHGHEGLLFDPKVEVHRGDLKLDEFLYQRMARRLLEIEPDAVGFTSLGCNFICTVKTARYIKQWAPSIPIMLGGPHATVLDREILESFSEFDVIARNEAECTIIPLVEALEDKSFSDIPGITFRRCSCVQRNPSGGIISDLDSLPFPAYHHYPVKDLGLKSLRVDAGRGCPFQCTFCSTATFFGRKYRLKSAERLVQELDSLKVRYGITDFALTHDLFTVNKRKVSEFCEAVKNRGYTWKCSARMDCVDGELLREMAAAGCRSIYYGIEAGSTRMQQISKKHLDLGLFDQTLASTQDLQMASTISFITGYPEEQKSDQDATLDLIGTCFSRMAAPLNIQLHLLTPEPGTELLEQYAGKILYDGHISDFNFPNLECDDAMFTEGHPSVFVNHHYFPSHLPRWQHVFVTTAYPILYEMGFQVLRYLVSQHGGKFSLLMHSILSWARKAGVRSSCTVSTVESYFEWKYGKNSHITGLVRYMTKASELRRYAVNNRQDLAKRTSLGQDTGRYQLSPLACVVRTVPDCPLILQQLASDKQEVPEAARSRRRYNFLLRLCSPETDTIENLVLNDPSAHLLEFFKECKVWNGGAAFESTTGYPAPPAEFLNSLVHRGVLETVVDGR